MSKFPIARTACSASTPQAGLPSVTAGPGGCFSEVLADLPTICAAHLPSDNSPILIKRGTRGYCQRWEAYDGERFNKHHGITDAQVGAMLAGSMFGFDCPGADPLNH